MDSRETTPLHFSLMSQNIPHIDKRKRLSISENSHIKDHERANTAWLNYASSSTTESAKSSTVSFPQALEVYNHSDNYAQSSYDMTYYGNWQTDKQNKQPSPLFVPPINKAVPIVNPITSQVVYSGAHSPKQQTMIDRESRPIKIVNPNVEKQNIMEKPSEIADHHSVADQSFFEVKKYTEINPVQQNMEVENSVNGTVNEHGIAGDTVNEHETVENYVSEHGIAEDTVSKYEVVEDIVNEDNAADGAANEYSIAESTVNETDAVKDAVDEEEVADDAVNEHSITRDAVNEREIVEDTVNEHEITENTVSETDVVNEDEAIDIGIKEHAGDTVKENEISENEVNEHEVTENPVRETDLVEDTVNEDEAIDVVIKDYAGYAVKEHEIAENDVHENETTEDTVKTDRYDVSKEIEITEKHSTETNAAEADKNEATPCSFVEDISGNEYDMRQERSDDDKNYVNSEDNDSMSTRSDPGIYEDSSSSSEYSFASSSRYNKPPVPVIKDFSTIQYPENIAGPEPPIVPGKIKYNVSFLLQFRDQCTTTDKDLSLITTASETNVFGSYSRGSSYGYNRVYSNNKDNNNNKSRSVVSRENSNTAPRSQEDNNSWRKPDNKGVRAFTSNNRQDSSRRKPRNEDLWFLKEQVTLKKSENRWVPAVVSTDGSASTASEAAADKKPDADDDNRVPQDIIARKVKSLLNKLTLEKFDSISGQIWEFAKQSELEEDAESAKHVLRLVLEKAVDEPNFAAMWAKLFKRISEYMAESGEKMKDTTELSGLSLFRRFLLKSCQEGFERGWTSTLPGMKENAMLSDEYYAAVKMKRQGLGLVQLIGELYKLQMLTDSIMVHCLMKFSANPTHAEDDETETLCKLITTIGETFDTTPKNSNWLDKYFTQMDKMYQSNTLSSRVKFKILDVFDLRKNKWVSKKSA